MNVIGAPTREHRTAMVARAWLIGVALAPPLLVLLFGQLLRRSPGRPPGPAAFALPPIALSVARPPGAPRNRVIQAGRPPPGVAGRGGPGHGAARGPGCPARDGPL